MVQRYNMQLGVGQCERMFNEKDIDLGNWKFSEAFYRK